MERVARAAAEGKSLISAVRTDDQIVIAAVRDAFDVEGVRRDRVADGAIVLNRPPAVQIVGIGAGVAVGLDVGLELVGDGTAASSGDSRS